MNSVQWSRRKMPLCWKAAFQKMESTIDTRMAIYENRISKEVSDLQKRTEQLELREKARADENNNPAVQEAKRRRRSLSVETGSDGVGSNARSRASSRRHDDEERQTPRSHAKSFLLITSSCSYLWWKGWLATQMSLTLKIKSSPRAYAPTLR